MSTDSPVTVRLATPADAVGIGTCHAASWREAYADLLSAEFLGRQDPDERIAVWTGALADDRNRIAVATVAVPTVAVPAVPVAAFTVPAGPVAAFTVPAGAVAGIAVPAAPTDDTFPTHPAVLADDTFPTHPAVPADDRFPTYSAVPTDPAAPAAGGQPDASGRADSTAPGPDRTAIEEVVGFAACRPRDPDEAAAGVEVDAAGPTDAIDPTDEAAVPAATEPTDEAAAPDHTAATAEAAASERTAADPAAATVAEVTTAALDPPRELAALYVRRAFHGTGIADALLDLAVGDGPCLLWVAERNPRAIAFYRRRGFRLDGHRGTIPAWEDLRIVRMVR